MEAYGTRDLSHVLPNHVNEEAVVFRGCTTTEITVITSLAAIFWLIITAIVGAATGYFYLILGFTVLLVLATAFVASTIFQVVKRGRAPGHYQHVAAIFLGNIKMRKSPFVLHDGTYTLGRTKQIALMSKHLRAETILHEEDPE